MNIGKLVQSNINLILVICILILIVYLVTSNEGFTMKQLENKKDINSDFDFVSIYKLIAVNLANLNTITSQEETTYSELVRNIEAKQRDGYIFDIKYIGNHITNPPTITTAPTTTVVSSSETFVSIPKEPIPNLTEIKVIDNFSDSQQITTPKGYILLDINQAKFLRYYVFLSLIRGIFDQLHRVNNYYFDPTGDNNDKYINNNFDTDLLNENNETRVMNGKVIISKCIIDSKFRGYPSITAGVRSTTLPTIDVDGGTALLNLYVDVIQNYINTGLKSDNVMKNILTLDIDSSGTKLVNDIENVIDDLIQHFHTFGLYYVNDTETDRVISSYDYSLTI